MVFARRHWEIPQRMDKCANLPDAHTSQCPQMTQAENSLQSAVLDSMVRGVTLSTLTYPAWILSPVE